MSIASTGASDWGRKPSKSTIEPLVISPLEACVMLDVSIAHLYKRVMTDPDVKVYKDGRSTKLIVASLKKRQDRLVAERQGKRTRGRPRKALPEAQAEAQG